eukprot:NODE_960_length_2883_cov_0.478807.p3 type:complete len:201 gc:universal NODE_960_length_2883_cov_0.478807:562-1164(+)
MKRKQLLSIIQQIDPFEKPIIELEQYSTPADIAVDIVNHAQVENKTILDLGCGTGMLSICALLLDAKHVYAVDVDENALEILQYNVDEFIEDLSLITIINSDVQNIPTIEADICICNPPFGTRQSGIDKLFIKKGMEMCQEMYSLHKSTTRQHLIDYCASINCKCKVLAQIHYNLDATYKFHKNKSKNIQVDLLQITRIQ